MSMGGLDYFGVDPISVEQSPRHSWSRTAIAAAAGALGAVLVPKHRVLAFLDAAAFASNAHALIARERTVKDAAKRMGKHVVATAASLAMPSHPGWGYVAGAIAADLLIDNDGGGLIDDWAAYEDVPSKRAPLQSPIDAEFTEVKDKALVKT